MIALAAVLVLIVGRVAVSAGHAPVGVGGWTAATAAGIGP